MISSRTAALGSGVPLQQGKSSVRGIGNEFYNIQGNWLSVAGKSGDVKYISINELLRMGIEVGIYVQATSTANVAYTLDHPATSTDPRSAADANWTADQSVTTAIDPTDAGVFTAVRVTFTADGFVTFFAM